MNFLLWLIIIAIGLMHCFEIQFEAKNNLIVSSVYIGTPLRKFMLLMDTGSPFLWVPDAKHNENYNCTFNSLHSTTFKDYESPLAFHRSSHVVRGTKSVDLVTLSSAEGQLTASLAWALAGKMEIRHSEYNGVFGFLRDQSVLSRFNDFTTFNYVDSLFKEHKIQHKTLSFKYASRIKGSIGIGNINLAEDKDSCSSLSMSSDERFSVYWYCQITSMRFASSDKQIELQKTSYALFITGQRTISAPAKEGLDIFLAYTKMSDNQCRVESSGSEDAFLICANKRSINTLAIIEVSFGEVIVRVDPRDLFEYQNGEYHFLMTLLPHDFIWAFGEPVLRHYNTMFDYSKYTVSFLYNDINESAISDSNILREDTSRARIVVTVCFALLLIVVVYFIIINIRRRKLARKRPTIDFNTNLLVSQIELGFKI